MALVKNGPSPDHGKKILEIVETTERRELLPGEPIHLEIDPAALLRLEDP